MSRPTILVADDERTLTDLYATWLADDYEVKTAYNGEQAVSHLDSNPAVVLLDRRMPELSGDKVLERIRGRGLTTPVVMLTAVQPDFDVVEMDFNEYLVKPIDKNDLRETVEEQLAVSSYDEQVRELFSLSAKVATLKRQKSVTELANSETYQQLTDRLEQAQADADTALDNVSTRDFSTLF